MSDDATKYTLVNRHLLRTLMQRTGTGERITTRQLAADIGIAHGTVGGLLTGAVQVVPESTAVDIAARIGVDLLVLFAPVCRANPAPLAIVTEAGTA
ncbi:helix-turn-helix domain-containing protein [Streptomyces sp. YPW6]|uniref:helix-turn-helix domain-containing protein n=1 Tax=Streptomyces sp. YPW6 TaxID=2840373 RepID=UPI003D73F50B